ncbi:MAG UNVERIFIED_CONTAM: cell division topological specificity factor MinE [Rickettsiaceae bacterium]
MKLEGSNGVLQKVVGVIWRLGGFAHVKRSVTSLIACIGRDKSTQSSSQVLTSRLKLVLMQDRANISTDKLKALREEILAVIAK